MTNLVPSGGNVGNGLAIEVLGVVSGEEDIASIGGEDVEVELLTTTVREPTR